MWAKAWRWLVEHLRTEDDDWAVADRHIEKLKMKDEMGYQRPGRPPSDKKSTCHECGATAKHKLWSYQAEGLLFTCGIEHCGGVWVTSTTSGA